MSGKAWRGIALACALAPAVVRGADAPAAAEVPPVETRTFRLNHASATEVAARFNTMWSGDFGQKWKVAKMAVAFEESNSVMVTAPKAVIESCARALGELDVEAQQVYIEARFVELGNNASHKVGIDWTLLGGTTATVGLGGGFQTTRLGKGVKDYSRTMYDNTETGTRTTTFSLAGGDNPNSDISYFNGVLDVSAMSVTLKALDTAQDARTFSNPKIIVSSGKKAKVDMTTKYPNVLISAKRTDASGSTSLDIASNLAAIPGEDKFMFAKEAFFSWGISLEVTPRVGTNGLINVSIVPTISSLDDWVDTGTTSYNGSTSGTVASKYPVIKVQRLISEFNLESGTTAVIGGLSVTEERQVDTGIPILRSIPLVGRWLFGSVERVKEQKEIIVFVTVGLVNPHAVRRDAGLPKNAVLGRQYVKGQRLEPGDRPEKSMEGIESLDMRSLEEQARDPLRRQGPSGMFDFREWLPFTKETEKNKTSNKN